MANSQVLFNSRVAETLAKAGHDVTMLMITAIDDFDSKDVKIMKEVKRLPYLGFICMGSQIERTRESYGDLSEHVLPKGFLNWLEAEKFDLAFSHMYDVCPIGLIHYAKIPSWIWLNRIFADDETAIFRELIGPDFPDLVDVAKKCPLVMVNSNELYDFPRPTLAKIVNIGGIGIQEKDAKPLPQEFQEIVDTAEGIVVFSFGTVAPSHKMPSKWKMAFIDAFKRFPRYHFLCKYQGTDLHDKISLNIHLFKWLPQSDLLQNPKTKAFISHGGYNSVQEAISAGVPMITIPLFGDQPKNAKIAEKHQFAVSIRKSDLSADTIAEALSKILGDKRLLPSHHRLGACIGFHALQRNKCVGVAIVNKLR
ncbi:UDP-glucoronosyl and UDP-glucosyl transferase [Necator americanus]|uniref:UDP-glucuronosyltransferase n=1 Tax=Necator americanus TaxID=51031 RepID=W2TRA3_NECAM|nr:UDP-glucoronosyl and UDP-glucosyl transferase [Necator americanus]ETN83567.1 UDP-glucoronosyl and UDP-glucosyl transferase [Necator americanus]